MESLPYYKWMWRDYRSNRKVQRMPWQARGLYRELLDEFWSEGHIPNDLHELAEVCGCTYEEIEMYWPSIRPCWELSEDGQSLYNPKMDEQRTAKDAHRAKSARSAREAALARIAAANAEQLLANAQRTLANAEGTLANAGDVLANASDRHIAEQSRAEHEHEQSRAELLPGAHAPSPKLATILIPDESVERVYQAYPRKVGRIKALVAIRKAVTALSTGQSVPAMPSNDALRFLHGKALKFAQSPAGQQGEFTPHPSTWFNEGRYLDDESEWQRMGQPRGIGNGAGNGRGAGENPASARNARSTENIKSVFGKIRTGMFGNADGSNEAELSGSGNTRGDAGDVGSRVDGANGEVRAGSGEARPARPHDGVEILSPAVGVTRGNRGQEARTG